MGGFEGGEGGRGYGLADRVAVGGFGDDGAGWEGLASTAERGAAGGIGLPVNYADDWGDEETGRGGSEEIDKEPEA